MGHGVKQDYKKGVELYELAGKQGDTIALCNLGKLYRDGEGVDKDVNAAKEYFLRAVELGGRYADYLIGDMYERHFLDDDNYKNAVMWYTKSAEKGYDVGLLSLGEMYGFVGAKSVNEAIKIIEKAEANNIEIECLDLDYDLEEYASDGGDAFKVSLFCKKKGI